MKVRCLLLISSCLIREPRTPLDKLILSFGVKLPQSFTLYKPLVRDKVEMRNKALETFPVYEYYQTFPVYYQAQEPVSVVQLLSNSMSFPRSLVGS